MSRVRRQSLAIGAFAAAGAGLIGLLVFRACSAPRNPFARIGENPTRLTGTIRGRTVDEGPDRAQDFQSLLSAARHPNHFKCYSMGDVTLHYPSGRQEHLEVGCCSAWIDGNEWEVGGNIFENFFPRQP